MAAPDELANVYNGISPALGDLERYVRDTTQSFAHSKGCLFTGRVKALNSLSEKIETGRVMRWSDLDDLYACTVVISSPSQESQVRNYLKTVLRESHIRDRVTTN